MITNPLFRSIIFCSGIFLVTQLFFIVPSGAALQGLQAGMEAPLFSLKSISGGREVISGPVAEKLAVVVFWSTWSRNSDKELLMLEKLYEKYGSAGLSIIAINVDGQEPSEQDTDSIRLKVRELGIKYIMLLDPGLKTFHDYGVIAVPSTVVLDKDRIIRYELSGFSVVGSGEMADVISAAFEGRKAADIGAADSSYRPDRKAVRLFNMGRNDLTLKSSSGTAEMWFKKAIEADPKFLAPYLALGKYYGQRDEISPAREMFEKALTVEPGNQVALCELALLMIRGGKPDEGKSLIEQALTRKGTYPPCYLYLGSYYAKEGSMDDALKSFDEAIRLNPLDPAVYIAKGRICEDKGMLQEATTAYRKALELILGQ